MGFDFDGCIREVPGISIDCFANNDELNKFKDCSTFFLSHCHSDHMTGLFDGFLSNFQSNDKLKLFCTVESEIILRNMASIDGIDATAVLDRTVTKMAFDREYDLDIDGFQVKVTAIRAKHCAGSCMFLFKTEYSNVLYTGDFRYYPKQLKCISALRDFHINKIPLDTIYLDTTFLLGTLKSYPTKKRAFRFIKNEIRQFRLKNPNGIVHIKRPANLGSELMIKMLARAFETKIHVEDKLCELYKDIANVRPFLTSDPSETFIHLLPMDENCKRSHECEIRPTALWFAYYQKTTKQWKRIDEKGRLRIAHSMHATANELRAFIEFFKPRRAVALAYPDGGSIEEVQEKEEDLQQFACYIIAALKLAKMSFSGFIKEIPGLSVDSFQKENFKKSSTFFLTHCHTDHTTGLINGFLNHIYANSNLILYCSSESATILKNMYPAHTNLLDNIICTLPFNKNWFISINGMSVGVTAIRANHCAGSCMFLFRTNESTVLYTGDFRFHRFELEEIKALHYNGRPIELDNVYLDTTFLKQKTYKFPTRKRAIHLLLREIDDFLDFTAGQGIVHISRPANIGSEIIIRSLAREFNCLVHVDDECYNLYRGVEPVFSCVTNNPNNTFIHMCKPGKPGTNHFCNCPAALKIRLSAQWYAIQENTDWVQWEGDRAVNIAHSMHSSREELEAFLDYFKPGCAVALVIPDGYSREQIQKELICLMGTEGCF
ncbi:Hypothetical predicted protein [Cloeon dipterum]|uniref:Protein artemis n=1 Tax=Cloeon dipterum TaxID=197152 RepID=A0A8S1DSW5_9INSE|nr:Hypothetical predicted protein [Cloeon dipterum]